MPRLSKIGAAALAAFGWTSGSSVTATYLVVAGGGGGGAGTSGVVEGGGGGAGGYRTSTASLNPTLSYTVTVGAGGTSNTNGSDSIFSATTSTGGGAGGRNGTTSGSTGGSGGGAGGVTAAGANGNTPSTSPSQGNNGGAGVGIPVYASAGGGGAGAVGGTAVSAPGAGGAGTANSITGSSVTYGGGGGGTQGGTTSGAGGAGGGGAGATSGNGSPGTANLGGGGGAGSSVGSGAGGQGGSGVVIISYPGAQQFGGGNVTTDGTNTIHTFTTSGTLVPATPLTAQYLIVAGGAGGGGNYHTVATGGGGGAGGLLTGTGLAIDANSNYVVVVGAGGAGGTGGAGTNGVNGTNSSFSMVATAAVGGGYGATNQQAGGNGGSGGGASGPTTAGSFAGGTATSGQGNAGGSANQFQGGGGGGAGAVGASGATGNGGNGLASSISGSSVTYAGGGGQTGGTGGGGNAGVAGTANTGGGGGMGAGGANNAGGAGGSGVVIIAYPGSTQQMAGGTVTISGGNVIHTFTSSGYLTPIKYASRSLRFRSSASAYLNRTPPTAGNRKTYTISFWMKRGLLGSQQFIFTGFDGSTSANIQFTSGDLLAISVDGNVGYQITSSQVLRDPSAWYHFVFAVDTTQATAANRIKMYVNGVQVTALSSSSYPPQNNDTYFFGAFAHWIGSSQIPSLYTDMYMTEFNAVNGAALTPSSFGTFNSFGVWQPITYGGSYGTNGFYLTFGNNTSTTTLGYDTSPQGNNWTTNNISVTAGVTYDSMTDVPTLTSATVANYATGNPVYADASVSATYTNGNLTWSCPNTGSGKATISATTGKFYWEAIYLTNAFMTGVADAASVGRYNNSILYQSDGTKGINGTFTSYGATYTTGDVIGVALDLDGGTVTFYKNNSSQGSISLSLASITNATAIIVGGGGSANTGNWNFGQRPFTYTPPSGFVALNTYNLSTPTIPNGAVYMAATLYTGTNATLAIANTVNGTNFQPDWVWVKGRSGATDHALYDVVRGTTKQLESNTTTAETTEATGLTAFGSTGFTVGALAQMNTSAATYVAWQWAANGTGVTNTSGTITSTVSANTTAGFAVVTYTGTNTAATVGHGLGVTPNMIIVKQRNSAVENWLVYHSSLTNPTTSYLYLNSTDAQATAAIYWNGGPTSSVFGIGAYSGINASAGTYVAYVFAAIAGYSAFGSYTGNGSTDGPFVYTGFRPRFVVIKRSSASGQGWQLYDNARNPYNAETNLLYPNGNNAEQTGNEVDVLSNGFKLRSSDTPTNSSGVTYIYMAFAENPFKYANAR